MKTESQKLLWQVDTFLAKTGISATAFGIQALGDCHFVKGLRGGREPRSPTRNKVVQFMKAWRKRPLASDFAKGKINNGDTSDAAPTT